MRAARISAAAALVLFAASCGHHRVTEFIKPESNFGPVRCIAVMPFENLTEYYEAGKIVPDIVATELYISRKFGVVERTEVQRVMRENNIIVKERVDPVLAQQIGVMLSVDAVIIGSVSEYWYRTFKGKVTDVEPTVGINLRLVDVKTGAILWASSHTRSSYDLVNSQRDPINRVTQIVARDMVDFISGNLQGREANPLKVCSQGSRRPIIETREAPAQRKPAPAPAPAPVVEEKLEAAKPEPAVPKPEEKPRIEPAVVAAKPAESRPEPWQNAKQEGFFKKLTEGKDFPLADVTFKGKQANLNIQAIRALNDFGIVLKKYQNSRIMLNSHVDSSGSLSKDLELSTKRGEAVKDYLVKAFNISAARIEVKGYGGTKPIMPNINRINREKNKRIEVSVLKGP
jgi:outer membrane protein OmpA-like peptidoglycan-associated protein/TolB-like protein